MLRSQVVYIFSLLFIFSLDVFAETYRMNASYFVRGSQDFNSSNNKVGVLTTGSTFTVLKRKKLSNGAEALQIHVVGLSPTSNLNPSDTYWIYKSNNAHFTKMDRDSQNDTQAQAPELPCVSCASSAQPSPQTASQNTGHLADVSRTIITQQNQTEEPRTPGILDEQIKKYSESAEVNLTIKHALANKKSRSQGTCYRSVKKALLAAPKGKPGTGLISHYYSDLAALNSKNSLQNFGFVNLLDVEPYKTQIKLPSQAPKGSVLVYSSGIPCGGKNGVKDCGHVEIKVGDTGKPGYVSDYYSKDAINQTPGAIKYGSRYKLVGVMIKP